MSDHSVRRGDVNWDKTLRARILAEEEAESFTRPWPLQ
jgi:hypothetical protein